MLNLQKRSIDLATTKLLRLYSIFTARAAIASVDEHTTSGARVRRAYRNDRRANRVERLLREMVAKIERGEHDADYGQEV